MPTKAWVEANRDHLRKYRRGWMRANREKVKRYEAAMKAKDPDGYAKKRREKSYKWREENKERSLESNRASYHRRKADGKMKARKTPAKQKAMYAKRYREKERIRERQRYAENSDRFLVRNHNRRARLAGAPGDGVTARQWEQIRSDYGSGCAYCAELTSALEMDHVDPISKGGAHDPMNVVPACKSCNSSKRDRSILYWLAAKIAA